MAVGVTMLTAQEMRSAEAAAIGNGTSEQDLMERAGAGAAEAVRRFAGPLPALVLCGPGNNGGDGYVIARVLKEQGVDVRVASLADPGSEAAKIARSRWTGPVEPISEAAPAPLLIDALFGTGLSRPLEASLAQRVADLAQVARVKVAVDLPSGVATDNGAILSAVPDFDLTTTFGTKKPSHLLQPAAGKMGRIVVADIGIVATSFLWEIGQPELSAPGPQDHKYSRGYVALLEGEMPGAISLAAAAAARTGAGYVRIGGSTELSDISRSIVQGRAGGDLLGDKRIGALIVGPGLGRSDDARHFLKEALASGHRLILDADALVLLSDDPLRLRSLPAQPILTPHAGEFDRLFGNGGDSKVDRARQAARESGAVIVFKGPDTVVASPDGRAAIAPPAPNWLASAGTGDVLSGIAAAIYAREGDAFEAACAAVWIHGRAAEAAGPVLVADDLVEALPQVVARCSG